MKDKTYWELNQEEYDDMDIAEWYETYKKCKKLEKEIGCPVEVRCKLYNGAEIYDKNGKQYVVKYISRLDILSCVLAEDYDNGKRSELTNFKIEEYKKTWWLKANRME